MTKKQTLYDKIWAEHLVGERSDGAPLLYIDRHLLHEITSPQAFAGLDIENRSVWRAETTIAVPDHNVPTTDRDKPIENAQSALQVSLLRDNCEKFGIEHIDLNDKRQGIVHVIGPEMGLTQPGLTIVCGDSHTSTHGAFGALAFGIGTSEVEHVLSTQTIAMEKSKSMLVNINGELPVGVSAKDMALAIIAKIGASGGAGYVIEYAGSTVKALSMEGRMTLCNMTIEAGARAGMIAPDKKTIDYVKGRPRSPSADNWDKAIKYWRTLASDEGAQFDKTVTLDAAKIAPFISWGTSPDQSAPITGTVPTAKDQAYNEALNYMGLSAGTKFTDIEIDRVFIGSCTNSRIEDLREVAKILKDKHISPRLKSVLIVPGSGLIKAQAEQEGLAKIFIEAGCEWREAGCSMCLGLNPDKVAPFERCASTSNRNFVGRQGPNARTHLMSPAMAAAAALKGRLSDVRELTDDGGENG